mmetsp:Transcript_42593/g.131532  ORF Transcript_42593/g.131532 Transcript_42593/m.131532 type:complete len:394 (-) Transcript_42593:19-1200(-)
MSLPAAMVRFVIVVAAPTAARERGGGVNVSGRRGVDGPVRAGPRSRFALLRGRGRGALRQRGVDHPVRQVWPVRLEIRDDRFERRDQFAVGPAHGVHDACGGRGRMARGVGGCCNFARDGRPRRGVQQPLRGLRVVLRQAVRHERCERRARARPFDTAGKLIVHQVKHPRKEHSENVHHQVGRQPRVESSRCGRPLQQQRRVVVFQLPHAVIVRRQDVRRQAEDEPEPPLRQVHHGGGEDGFQARHVHWEGGGGERRQSQRNDVDRDDHAHRRARRHEVRANQAVRCEPSDGPQHCGGDERRGCRRARARVREFGRDGNGDQRADGDADAGAAFPHRFVEGVVVSQHAVVGPLGYLAEAAREGLRRLPPAARSRVRWRGECKRHAIMACTRGQ